MKLSPELYYLYNNFVTLTSTRSKFMSDEVGIPKTAFPEAVTSGVEDQINMLSDAVQGVKILRDGINSMLGAAMRLPGKAESAVASLDTEAGEGFFNLEDEMVEALKKAQIASLLWVEDAIYNIRAGNRIADETVTARVAYRMLVWALSESMKLKASANATFDIQEDRIIDHVRTLATAAGYNQDGVDREISSAVSAAMKGAEPNE